MAGISGSLLANRVAEWRTPEGESTARPGAVMPSIATLIRTRRLPTRQPAHGKLPRLPNGGEDLSGNVGSLGQAPCSDSKRRSRHRAQAEYVRNGDSRRFDVHRSGGFAPLRGAGRHARRCAMGSFAGRQRPVERGGSNIVDAAAGGRFRTGATGAACLTCFSGSASAAGPALRMPPGSRQRYRPRDCPPLRCGG